MILSHTKMAIRTIRASRVRSMLTTLGIIIGVCSVTLSVALAQGLRSNTNAQLKKLGDSFITVEPGVVGESKGIDSVKQIDIGALLRPTNVASTLTPKDADSVAAVPEVGGSAPVMFFNSTITNGKTAYENQSIIATSPDFPGVLNKQVDSGAFFADGEVDKPFAVLGHDIAATLFGVDTPIGSEIKIRDKTFVILGVMQAEKTSNVRVGPAFDNAVFVSIPNAKTLNGGDARFQFIYVDTIGDKQTTLAAAHINTAIKTNHGGERDFSVLTKNDAIAISNKETRLVTTVAILIMSISLLVAGVGIMNVMLMLVTERTREIGIRKALGATNRQIASQFFTEALVLTTLGGLAGLSISGITVAMVNAYTEVKMTLSLPLVLLGLFIPIVIGSIFGLLPAMKAARKDPIVALRNE